MPAYVCYRGVGEEIPQDEPGCFVVDDDKGRRWFCREAPKRAPGEVSYDAEALQFAYGLTKKGIKVKGQVFMGNRENENDLREALSSSE